MTASRANVPRRPSPAPGGRMSPLIHVLLGTKAELIKVSPVLAELDRRGVAYRLVETGQHGAYLPRLRE